MDTLETWTVTVRSRMGEDLTYVLTVANRRMAVALARDRARQTAPLGLWPWPVISAESGDWRREDALEGRR